MIEGRDPQPIERALTHLASASSNADAFAHRIRPAMCRRQRTPLSRMRLGLKAASGSHLSVRSNICGSTQQAGKGRSPAGRQPATMKPPHRPPDDAPLGSGCVRHQYAAGQIMADYEHLDQSRQTRNRLRAGQNRSNLRLHRSCAVQPDRPTRFSEFLRHSERGCRPPWL